MKYFYNSIIETIGKTPLVKLNRITENISPNIFVKLESFNPGGSVKDRIALSMILKAEEEGIINKDTTIVECQKVFQLKEGRFFKPMVPKLFLLQKKVA